MKNQELAPILKEFDAASFQEDLVEWFRREKRQLPWREDQDPYKVWVSEIMLQQTKVDTVIPYFNRFIRKFPTLNDLADAEEQEVLKAWEGLGYYSRARNLQNAVREVVTSYQSKVPDNAEELGALKGVGPYTKGAILSIAYDVPEPAVDGNVMRVLSRILLIEEDIAKQKTRKLFESVIREIISTEFPSDFNQGLMELGALVCTPKSPACLLCPVQAHCRAYAQGVEQELPIKSKSKKQKKAAYIACVVKDSNDRYLVEQRPDNGLLANMWQFPMVPLTETDEEHAAVWFYQTYGLKVKLDKEVDQIKHVFSHIIWEIKVMTGEAASSQALPDRFQFIRKSELTELPFPVSHQKILKHLD